MSTTLVDSSKDAQKILSQVSAMAMVDEDFKSRLTEEPISVLSEFGLKIPTDMKIEISKSFEEVPAGADQHTLHLIIPEVDELSDENLSLTVHAAASCGSTASTAFTIPSCVSSASTASSQSCE